MSIADKLALAQEICGHEFTDVQLLRSAITHPSAVEGEPVSASYERLEFLGDSILGSIVALSLFKTYGAFDEGKLTRLKVSLVSGATLSEVGLELGIDKIIILGASEQGTGARGMHSALENVYEALIGALYLDGGFQAAHDFIHRFVLSDLENKILFYDSKTVLQEMIQTMPEAEFVYALTGEEGPDHDKEFLVDAVLNNKVIGKGKGRTKKAAEQEAAYQALLMLKNQQRG